MKNNINIKKLVLTFLIFGVSTFTGVNSAKAVCKSGMLNPISDIRWSCSMPIILGGITVADVTSADGKSASRADKMGSSGSALCVCADQNILGVPRVGFSFAMNLVFRIGEAVKDPFCFPTLGFQINMGKWGAAGADQGKRGTGKNTFSYTHMISFLPTQILNLFIDSLCMQLSDTNSPFSILYMSEFMPQARSSELALILAPESILFANPVAQGYCMIDSALTTIELTDPIGYWCVGGHSIFPLSNHSLEVDYVDAASINIAKMIFQLSRTAQIFSCYGVPGLCSCFPTLMWNKREFRFQIAKPSADSFCRRMGKPSILWNTPNKNSALMKAGGEDNLLFMIWRRRDCCAL